MIRRHVDNADDTDVGSADIEEDGSDAGTHSYQRNDVCSASHFASDPGPDRQKQFPTAEATVAGPDLPSIPSPLDSRALTLSNASNSLPDFKSNVKDITRKLDTLTLARPEGGPENLAKSSTALQRLKARSKGRSAFTIMTPERFSGKSLLVRSANVQTVSQRTTTVTSENDQRQTVVFSTLVASPNRQSPSSNSCSFTYSKRLGLQRSAIKNLSSTSAETTDRDREKNSPVARSPGVSLNSGSLFTSRRTGTIDYTIQDASQARLFTSSSKSSDECTRLSPAKTDDGLKSTRNTITAIPAVQKTLADGTAVTVVAKTPFPRVAGRLLHQPSPPQRSFAKKTSILLNAPRRRATRHTPYELSSFKSARVLPFTRLTGGASSRTQSSTLSITTDLQQSCRQENLSRMRTLHLFDSDNLPVQAVPVAPHSLLSVASTMAPSPTAMQLRGCWTTQRPAATNKLSNDHVPHSKAGLFFTTSSRSADSTTSMSMDMDQ